jgi:hypothetical protein
MRHEIENTVKKKQNWKVTLQINVWSLNYLLNIDPWFTLKVKVLENMVILGAWRATSFTSTVTGTWAGEEMTIPTFFFVHICLLKAGATWEASDI